MTNAGPEVLLQRRFLPAGSTVVVLGETTEGLAAAWAGHDRHPLAVPPDAISDQWAAQHGIRHIDWLLIHSSNRGAAAVLDGARALLQLRRIEFIQFDHVEAGGTGAAVYRTLQGYGYAMFRFADRNLEFVRELPAADAKPCTHLAVAPRHWQRLFTRDHSMFRYADLFSRHGIVPRGIIHVGAHEGEEYDNYRQAGCRRVVFIEADPQTFARLTARHAGNMEIRCINRAVSDKTGEAVFSRMSGSQSSSLLPPHDHLTHYPHITVAETFTVHTMPLPDILAAHHLIPADYNILAVDTQGAERLILSGCGDLLNSFDAVITEVNYAELYQGCGRIADIDDILFARGFIRAEEISPHHYTWGDAFYVRR